jgi:hypothetical protein
MGDFSDLGKHDVAFKVWLPEPVKHTLVEISDRSNLSVSVFLRQFLAIHCYGLYAFYQMTETMPNLFKDRNSSGIRYSFAMEEPPEGKKRVDTYWVVELGKNIAPIKLWIPTRLKTDLKTLAEHVGLTPSNYVREILISRLLGHGMLFPSVQQCSSHFLHLRRIFGKPINKCGAKFQKRNFIITTSVKYARNGLMRMLVI